MLNEKDWHIVYYDPISVVFMKNLMQYKSSPGKDHD
jgi:hypothetical protein